jgi:hypothetical protein
VLSTENEQYGYAADIAFLTLYVKEILAISTPAITYSKLDKYPDWVQGISSLKSSVLVWNDRFCLPLPLCLKICRSVLRISRMNLMK